MAGSKKLRFSTPHILNIFCKNFRDWSLEECYKLMQRAIMWLNLYGCQAICCKLKKGVKAQKMHFYAFFDLGRTTWWPYRLSLIDAFSINISYSPNNQSLKFLWKNIENWWSWKSQVLFWFFFSGPLNFCFQKKNFFASLKSVTK